MPVTKEEMSGVDPTLEICEKHMVSLPYLIKKLKKALNAKTTRFFQYQGEVIQHKDVIDWGTREKARMDAHKLRDDYPAEKTEHSFADLPTMTAVVREMMKEKDGGS